MAHCHRTTVKSAIRTACLHILCGSSRSFVH